MYLPADLRTFYSRTDDMLQMDANLMRIWSLDEIEKEAGPSGLAYLAPHTFIICDYLIWSEAYAITLSADPTQATPVVAVGTGHFPILAASWTQFLNLLLTNSPTLHDF